MAGIVLIPLLPVAAYCVVQTARDCRRRRWAMAVWGAIVSAGLVYLLVGLLAHPGY